MREITVPLESFVWPYVTFCARKPGRRKLSLAQRRAVALMREGVWYEHEGGEPLLATLNALVGAGWCHRALIARRGPDGKVSTWTHPEMLMHVLLDEKPKVDQPLSLYRLVDGARGEQGSVFKGECDENDS